MSQHVQDVHHNGTRHLEIHFILIGSQKEQNSEIKSTNRVISSSWSVDLRIEVAIHQERVFRGAFLRTNADS